uniref:Ig-like domain-containing protein n=1 Tax=Panthera tigris altaica TaxID=74533 RepID=A0A8C9M5R0_PANTA
MATFPSFFFVLGGSKPYNVCVSLIIVLTATPISPTAKSPDEDTSPKPTIFLPSNAERKLHKAGTYLCLLEDFFPDVIKIDWKEKNGRVILKSQQGDTMKIKDTYMKYTWLTVREDSMGKEHKCIVKHEKNKGGVDQEILFPSINTGETNRWLLLDPLQLQLVNTSAYYTYLLLLVKSVVYTVITAICLLGRAALCDNGKSS